MQKETIKDIIQLARGCAQDCETAPSYVLKSYFTGIAERLERLEDALPQPQTQPQEQPRKYGMTANDKHVLAYNMAERDVAISVSADRLMLDIWTIVGTVDGRRVITANINGGTTLARSCCRALCKGLTHYRMRNRLKRQRRAARAAAAKEVQ